MFKFAKQIAAGDRINGCKVIAAYAGIIAYTTAAGKTEIADFGNFTGAKIKVD